MSPIAHTLLEIVGRTAAIYLLILLGVLLSGKREVGQMTPFDLTLLLLLSNAVQNAMTGPDTSLAGGAVAAATLLVLNYGVAEFAGFNRRFRRLVQGSPSLLIHNGKVVEANMRASTSRSMNCSVRCASTASPIFTRCRWPCWRWMAPSAASGMTTWLPV